jgi:lipopolysaccharide/colanic/teichoic acid biosynthesis glycosyltransferase
MKHGVGADGMSFSNCRAQMADCGLKTGEERRPARPGFDVSCWSLPAPPRLAAPSPAAQGARDVQRPTRRAARATESVIRLFDILGALLILIGAFPVLFVAGLLIKLTSRGPILYRQERVGKGGRIFILYKFRTMIDNAEKYVGPVWASPDDERVTPVGRILRQTRLDELPQLYNILRGDMSLVGPRPERPYFVERHQSLQGLRLAVKPGLTGLAQVRSFYNLKPAHKVRYDYLYIQHRSLLLNLSILLQTIPALFTRKGW